MAAIGPAKDSVLKEEDVPSPGLNELAKFVHDCQVKKGWWDEGDRHPADVLLNMVGEISEAWEEIRKGKPVDLIYVENGKPEGVVVELIDKFIRFLDYAGRTKMDLDKAFKMKMAYNSTRSYRHGNKKY